MATEKELILTDEFKAKVAIFKEDFYQKYCEISREQTPQVDGEGRKVIEKRPDGYDYITEAYMRNCLDRHFPGWSWEGMPLTFLGSEWVVAQGHLVIVDEHLLAFGIDPPVRRFFGVDSIRIQYRTERKPDGSRSSLPHTPENIVDIGDNCKSANSAALKYAINRLTHIGDDVYGKRIEYEGAGTYESILEAKSDANAFGQWVTEHKLSWGDIVGILGVKSMSEVTNFSEAYRKVKGAKGIE